MSITAGRLVCSADVENNNNYSASWVRTVNRNASTDSADIAPYNPAGVPLLRDGLYLVLCKRMFFRDYSHETTVVMNGVTERARFGATNDIYSIPSGFAVWKRGALGIFGTFTVVGGGGGIEYSNGVHTTFPLATVLKVPNPAVEGYTATYAPSVGAAYRVAQWLSVALAVRGLLGHASAKVTARADMPSFKSEDGTPATAGDRIIDARRSARGISGIAGLDIIPAEPLVIGIRYEHQTVLEWTYDKMFDATGLAPFPEKGTRYRRDLPGVLGVGVAYRIIPSLSLEASFSATLNKQARLEEYTKREDGTSTMVDFDGTKRGYRTGLEIGLAAQYDILPTVGVSLGTLFARTGANEHSYYDLLPPLSHVLLVCGAVLKPRDRFRFDFGVLKAIYLSDELERESSGEPPLDFEMRGIGFAFQMEARAF